MRVFNGVENSTPLAIRDRGQPTEPSSRPFQGIASTEMDGLRMKRIAQVGLQRCRYLGRRRTQ